MNGSDMSQSRAVWQGWWPLTGLVLAPSLPEMGVPVKRRFVQVSHPAFLVAGEGFSLYNPDDELRGNARESCGPVFVEGLDWSWDGDAIKKSRSTRLLFAEDDQPDHS